MTSWRARVSRCLGPNIYSQVPDGGWGWLVAAAFFFVEVFTYGIIKCFGIFLPDLMSDFGESNSRVSWIISICVFVMTFTAPLSSIMSSRFGYRPVVMTGGLLISLGTIATAFTTSIDQMYATMGIVSGLGYCLTFLPTVTILSLYFSRRRSLVTAVASTGECFSMFAFAPAFSALKQCVGWRYCLVLVGLLQSSIVLCGLLLRPIVVKPEPEDKPEGTEDDDGSLETAYALENELTHISNISGDSGVQSLSASWPNLVEEITLSSGKKTPPLEENTALVLEDAPALDDKTLSTVQPVDEESPLRTVEAHPRTQPPSKASRSKLVDFSVLRDGGFICYTLFGLFATLGFFAPQLYIIPLSISRGVAPERAALMLSAMAVAEVVGRVGIGVVLARVPIRKLHALLGCVAAFALMLGVMPFVTGFWGLGTCCVLSGFLLGTVASTHIPMLAEDDVVGIQRMPSAAGVYVFIQSFAGLAGPPLGGFLVDFTKDYGSAFYSCAAGMALGALFLGCVLPAKRATCCASQTRTPHTAMGEDTLSHKDVPSKQVFLEDKPIDFVDIDLVLEVSTVKLEAETSVI